MFTVCKHIDRDKEAPCVLQAS